MNNKKIIPIIIILAVVFAILGATFAYWSWASDNANKTNVTFTITADFSCGINGEGNITGANLAPASCTNATYAIQRAITTTITNNGSDPVSMDMWLKVNSIDSGLANSSNFKWALTTDSTSCTNNEVSHGNFQGKTSNSTITLFTGETNTSTYYLYIWLDSAETSTATQNQSFSLSIGGACTNEVSSEEYVYTANICDENDIEHTLTWINQPISSSITIYHDPNGADNAMAALKTYSGGITDYPFYLMHKLDSNGTVTESYVGFVITPAMVTDASTTYMTNCGGDNTCINAYNGPTAGTYTLQGEALYTCNSDWSQCDCKPENIDQNSGECRVSTYYSTNVTTLVSAYGTSFCTDYSSNFQCIVPGLLANAYVNGNVYALDDDAWSCEVVNDGNANCCVPAGSGGGGD